ncbi:DNA polymerase, partial [Romboutsia sp.]|uniref:DNA polymerase n=1 Tax=Romboutsia sp. TaxID=1965302 RepID=UPI003F3F3DE4
MILYLDIETKSNIDLAKSGVYAYTEDNNFEILLMAYAFEDEEVKIIELANGEPLPSRVKAAILDNNITKSAFNANFERICLSKYLNTYLPPKAFSCTQGLALSLGLPTSLDSVAKALNLDIQKDTEGKSLIKYFNNNKPSSHLEKWNKFKDYCKTDCIVERTIRKKLEKYKIPDYEKEVYLIDQVINDRGVRVDTSFVNKAIELNLYNEKILKEKLQTTTNIKNIKSSIQVKNYLKENFDIEVESVNKENINILIQNSQNQDLIEFLNLRQSINKTSIKKYQAMNRTITKDNTIKGLFQYYGANKTGRWSGRLVQVQNLPQTNLEKLDLLRGVIKELPTEKAYSIINKLNENTQEVLSKLIRTAFISQGNKKLIISDFSAIEARLLSYLAREKWRIEVFNTHGKIYEASAAKMFNTDINLITKDSPLRQKGKIAELALGYQGGVNALKTMGAGSLEIEEDDLLLLVKHFRNNNPNIV